MSRFDRPPSALEMSEDWRELAAKSLFQALNNKAKKDNWELEQKHTYQLPSGKVQFSIRPCKPQSTVDSGYNRYIYLIEYTIKGNSVRRLMNTALASVTSPYYGYEEYGVHETDRPHFVRSTSHPDPGDEFKEEENIRIARKALRLQSLLEKSLRARDDKL